MQEFIPRSQSQDEQSLSDEVSRQRSSYRVAKSKAGDMPKDEHPSTFESIPPYSYQAQSPKQISDAPQDQRFAFEADQRYHPDAQSYKQQQVPLWAQPQRQKGGKSARWIIFLILGIILIKPIAALITIIAAGIGVILGIVAFAILLPIIVILTILVALAIFALIVLTVLKVPIGQGRWRRGPERFWRRGPGRWL
jgi:hypothetical protein